MRKVVVSLLLLLVLIIPAYSGKAQTALLKDSSFVNCKRLRTVIISESVLFAGSLFLLNSFWYKNYPHSSFHFINDNKEWLQMDKLGHIKTSCTIGQFGYSLLKWSGVDNSKAIWYGGCMGSVYLLTVEILDAYSKEWGFSPGDFACNTLGSLIFMGQQFAWNDQRIRVKFSYHETKYAKYRPDLLGENLSQTWLKDYNGQTYWLSGNISAFMKKDTKFPKWINIAFGYGAEGMLGGYSNPTEYEGKPIPHFNRYRQFYISPDIDFRRIKTKSAFLKGLFYVLNIVKCPAPALEFSKEKKFRFYPIYF